MTIEKVRMSLRDFIESTAAVDPDRPFIWYEDRVFTYAQFDRRVNQTANAFLSLGVKKGDKVCLMMSNRPEFLFTWLGLNKIGAIMVPINSGFKVPEAEYIVDHSEAIGIVSSKETKAVCKRAGSKSETIRWIASYDVMDSSDVVPFEKRVKKASESLQPTYIHSEDIASIIYTSGTTGPPKGVMHSHGAYILCGKAMVLRAALTKKDRLMIILPLFHANAQFYSMMGAFAARAAVVLTQRFSASHFWKQVYDYRVTQFSFIGAIGRILMARPKSEYVSGHQIRVVNGGPIPEDIYEALTKRFEIPEAIDGYGLTECTCVCHNPIYGLKKIGSMGLPAEGPGKGQVMTEMKVVDDQGHELFPNEKGELIIRSPLLMKGYFRQPDQTAVAYQNGWFLTGDYCYRDEDGYYFFIDRKKDIIRRRGENISSLEVESVLLAFPGIKEAAVVSTQSSLSEDEVKAFIVLQEGVMIEPETIIDWCRERLADFKIPRYLTFTQSLPKTPTQRVAKYILKQDKESGFDMEAYILSSLNHKRDQLK